MGTTELPSIALIDPAPLALHTGLPDTPSYPDVPALAAALDEGAAVPAYGVLAATTPDATGEVARAAHHLAASVLVAVQEWLAEPRLESSPLIIVTRGSVAAGPDRSADVPDLAASVVWGMIRTAQSEHPDRFVLLDIDPESGTPDFETLLAQAIATNEQQLACRDATLLTPRLATAEAAPDTDGASALDPSGTVLITGGVSPQGRQLARHLVEEHQVRHLVLTSPQALESPGADGLRDDLAERGAEVTITACDTTDRAALAGLLREIPDAHPLVAVIHAAGVLDSGVLESLTEQQLNEVLGERISGAVHLHELTRHLDLSAFILFSSAAGVIGGAGYAGLASASAFLDALAHRRRAQGLPALSVAWGAWESADAATDRPNDGELARLSREGAVPLAAEEGLALFDTALTMGDPMVVGTRVDASVLRERAMAGVLSPVWRGLVRMPAKRVAAAKDDAGLSLARRLIALPKAERGRVVLELVRGHAAAVLGHDLPARVEETRGFTDAGIDSLTAVELRNRLSAATGLQLPTTLVFDYPTPAELARHVVAELLGDKAEVDLAAQHGTSGTADEPIAVVGMACRFPGGVG
ncbi:hypothetical protein AV521_46155, partial [Streptomyces sp. IMTB 2501]